MLTREGRSSAWVPYFRRERHLRGAGKMASLPAASHGGGEGQRWLSTMRKRAARFGGFVGAAGSSRGHQTSQVGAVIPAIIIEASASVEEATSGISSKWGRRRRWLWLLGHGRQPVFEKRGNRDTRFPYKGGVTRRGLACAPSITRWASDAVRVRMGHTWAWAGLRAAAGWRVATGLGCGWQADGPHAGEGQGERG